ncbi:hypothetical protein NZA98_33340, partial [Escherichia coli]|nr:hypothetical protein [Escherichia coli]
NEAYAYAAVKSLVERGRRRIAMVAGPGPAHTYYWHLDDGFRRGLQESGAVPVMLDHWNGSISLDDVRNRTEMFMRQPNPPDGIICCTGGLTVAV